MILPDICTQSRHIAGGDSPRDSFNSPSGNYCWCNFLNLVQALLADTAVFRCLFKKMLLSGAIFQAQNTPKCVCGRGFAPDPLEKITELPYHLAGFQGATSQQRRGGKGREGREGEKAFLHFFFLQFNDCSAMIVAATYIYGC